MRTVTAPCYNFCMSLTSNDLADIKQLMESVLSGHTAEINKRFDKFDKHFEEVDKRLDRVDKRLDRVDERLDGIDKRLDEIDERLDKADERFDEIDRRLDNMDRRFDEVDKRLDNMDKRFDENEEVQNEILNAIGTNLNHHSARLDDCEYRLKKLEHGVA